MDNYTAEVQGLNAGDWVQFKFVLYRNSNGYTCEALIDNLEILDNSLPQTSNSNSSINFENCDISTDIYSSVNLSFDNVNYHTKLFNINHYKNNFSIINSTLKGGSGIIPIISNTRTVYSFMSQLLKNQINSTGIRMSANNSFTDLYGSLKIVKLSGVN